MTTATSTIVFTDVVDSTALRAALGEEAADQLFRGVQADLAAVVAGHGGRVVKTAGDGLMAAFDSATDAVRAAIAIQVAAAGRSEGISVRVGAATGDVSWEDGDCFGLPVVTAARLEAAAHAGQILVNNLVRSLAGDRSSAAFTSVGPLDLKGLPDPVRAFEVAWTPPEVPSATTEVRYLVPCPAPIGAAPAFPFVGREHERGELEAAWAAVLAGQRRTVLVGGEAGAGKTRLAFEFARRCQADGAAVLLGTCDAELAIPYQPWVQALDHLLRATPADVAATMSEDLAEVSVLVPQLERLVPGLRRPPPADPETQRHRLFNAVDAVLADAGRRWPTVVVVDDLHWAGAQTLALLRHLTRSAGAARLLVVGTFRDTGDELTEPLAGCLADLRRSEATTRLRLSGLDVGGVERFVAGVVGHELDHDLRHVAQQLAEHSGGNAFFIGELWRHVVAEGAVRPRPGGWAVERGAVLVGVPDSVREVVGQRLTRLSGGARRVVQLAAIAGLRVELRILVDAVDLPADDVGASLDELVEAKLLHEIGGVAPMYQFAHAIVRDTVERSVPSSARARSHLRLAEAYERVYEADRRPVLAPLARHFAGASGAGATPKALYYLRRAGAQALRAVAYEEAIGHLQVALELGPLPADRVDTLLLLGEARSRHGQAREAMDDFAEAFAAARELGLISEAVKAAAGFDEAVQLPGHPGDQAVEIVSQALALVGPEDGLLRTQLQASLARALAMAGRADEALRTGEEALAAAREHGDPAVLMAALQCALVYSVEPHRYLRDAEEVAELSARLGDRWAYAFALGCRVRGLMLTGRMAEARLTVQAHERAAREGRFVLYRYMAMSFDVMLAVIDGRFDDAEQVADRAHEFGASARIDFDAGVYGVQMYVIRAEQGRLHEVAPVLRLAAALAPDQPIWRPGLAALFAETGMLEEARLAFDRLAADDFAGVPRDAMWPASLTFLADVCADLGDRDRAAVLYEALQPFRGFPMMVGFTICLGPAERLMGRLAALEGRRAAAAAHFAAALDLAERSDSPVWRAHAQADWALALGDRPDLLEAARATARDLGMGGLLARSDAAAAAAHPIPSPARPLALDRVDGLSAREVEVLRLVAAGRSNREIGQQLFISPNTAANHVRSILQKTGSANRAEATAYAARHGLLDT